MNTKAQNLFIAKLIPKQEREERAITSWHISKLGSCLTGTYLERMGEKPDEEFDERTLRVFDVGKMFEQWLLEQIKKDTRFEITEQARVEGSGFSGYIDALVTIKKTKEIVPIEIKSKHSKAFWYMTKQGKPMRQHEYQLWMYMYLTGYPLGKLVYISKDDNAVQEFFVKLNDKALEKEVITEIDILNKAWETKTPPVPIIDPKDWRYKYCRWHKHCLKLHGRG